MPERSAPLPAAAKVRLARLLDDDFHQNPVHLLAHGYDATQRILLPNAVAMPRTMEQVKQILALALEYQFPFIPRGAGSGFSGGSLPAQGGLVLVLDRLDKFRIDPKSQTATAEPGVINAQLDKAARKHGLFYPPDPASREFCTLGGNVAENAGGPRCLKYGVTRDSVLSVDCWSPAIGYYTASRFEPASLLDLLVGSEGTLAVFLQIKVALQPAPTQRTSLSAPFASATDAGSAVQSLLTANLEPARLELLDKHCINAVEDYTHLGLPRDAGAMLLVELDGFADLSADADRARQVLLDAKALSVTIAADSAGQERLWQAREAISPALARIAPCKLNEDVAVPPSKLPDLLARVEEISHQYDLPIQCFGHAGDGNLHVNIMYDGSIAGVTGRVEMASQDIFQAVLELEGTISGEHGIGLAKAGFLAAERGEDYMAAMRATKEAFDPTGILNPGKMGM
jgi:glycolate oxidase subunit GlcD